MFDRPLGLLRLKAGVRELLLLLLYVPIPFFGLFERRLR